MSQPRKRRQTDEDPSTPRDSKILGVRVLARMSDQLEALARGGPAYRSAHGRSIGMPRSWNG
jgi:hypothetical protein